MTTYIKKSERRAGKLTQQVRAPHQTSEPEFDPQNPQASTHAQWHTPIHKHTHTHMHAHMNTHTHTHINIIKM